MPGRRPVSLGADAYPAAHETGTVFLSAFTTKTAIFTDHCLFWR